MKYFIWEFGHRVIFHFQIIMGGIYEEMVFIIE